MRLRFLGAEYTHHAPHIETQEGPVMGKYRGAAWHAKHHSMTVLPASSGATLRFLGRPYQAQV
ncbi:MAG: DUF4278 domain-containing protein [Nodosilinea sp.]